MDDGNGKLIGANAIRRYDSGAGIWKGIATGKDVIVAFIDTGIQYKSKSFQDKGGKTRILYIWDQIQERKTGPQSDGAAKPDFEVTVAGKTIKINEGVEYDDKLIDKSLAGTNPTLNHNDYNSSVPGHGSLNAGVAVSNGFQEDHCGHTYPGIAPDARIIMVKPDTKKLESSIIKAIAYIVHRTKQNGTPKPVVINISIGNNIGGSHDGTGELEKFIDVIVNDPVLSKGLSIVSISGNEANKKTHVKGNISVGSSKPLKFEKKFGKDPVILDTWVKPVNNNFLNCRLTLPGGSNISINHGDADKDQTFTGGYRIILKSSVFPVNGMQSIVVIIVPPALQDTANVGTWTLELINPNSNTQPLEYNLWSTFSEFADHTTAGTVSIPGTSNYVITVGSYDSDGNVSDFSGRGPTNDGRVKPDITAPGVGITSVDGDLPGWCERCWCCCCNVYHRSDSGTSISAPFVSGTIALMLELDKNLSHNQIKTLLLDIQNVNTNNTGVPPANNSFGFGKLNAQKVVEAVNRTLPTPRILNFASSESVAAGLEIGSVSEKSQWFQLEQEFMTSPGGQFFFKLGERHGNELFGLINHNKKVATVWHRNDGPLMLRLFGRLILKKEKPLPTLVNGKTIMERLHNIAAILKRFASPTLNADIDQQLPVLIQMQGKSVLQIMDYLKSETSWK
jgi:subtilisin family serine protease